MNTKKRKIEIFSAGCAACEDTIELVNKIACPSCEVVAASAVAIIESRVGAGGSSRRHEVPRTASVARARASGRRGNFDSGARGRRLATRPIHDRAAGLRRRGRSPWSART